MVEYEKRVKTKRWKQRTWIGYDSHLLFIPLLPTHTFPSLRIYDLHDADVAERRETFLSLLSRAVSLALFFPDSAAFLMSYLSTRSAKYALLVLFEPRCEVIYDDSCLSWSLCRAFALIMRALSWESETLFEIIAPFRINRVIRGAVLDWEKSRLFRLVAEMKYAYRMCNL